MKKNDSDFCVLIDTREKKPVLFNRVADKNFPGLKYRFECLKTGDYSIDGHFDVKKHTHTICVERKSLPDLFQSFGKNRRRFEKEFIRMSKFSFAAMVCESDFNDIIKNPPEMSKVSPKSVFRSIIAFSQRYNVHFYPCPSRNFAEKTIFIILKRFYDDRHGSGRMLI